MSVRSIRNAVATLAIIALTAGTVLAPTLSICQRRWWRWWRWSQGGGGGPGGGGPGGPVVGVAPVAVAVPAMGLAVAGAWAVPAMDLDGAVVRTGVVVAVDGAIITVVDMVGAGGMAAAGATMPGAAGGISATRLILIDRRLAVNLRRSWAHCAPLDTPPRRRGDRVNPALCDGTAQNSRGDTAAGMPNFSRQGTRRQTAPRRRQWSFAIGWMPHL